MICDNFSGYSGRQWDLMWHGTFPHNKMEWINHSVITEYNAIIKSTLITPKYLYSFIKINIIDGFRTMFDIKIDEGLFRFNKKSSPWTNIKAFYPRNFHSFIEAKQQMKFDELPFGTINKLINWGILIISLSLLFVYIKFDQKNNFKHITFIGVVVLLWMLNALVTTTLSTYMGRFNARIVWIVPFSLFLAILRSKYYLNNKLKQEL